MIDRTLRSVMQPFYAQKKSAEYRGIPWELTFDEWVALWDQSGHWERRGRQAGGFVMSRKGDLGSYAIGNVEIVSNKKNFLEARKRSQPRGGVYLLLPGSAKPWVAKFKNKHLGYFASEQEARVVRAAAEAEPEKYKSRDWKAPERHLGQ